MRDGARARAPKCLEIWAPFGAHAARATCITSNKHKATSNNNKTGNYNRNNFAILLYIWPCLREPQLLNNVSYTPFRCFPFSNRSVRALAPSHCHSNGWLVSGSAPAVGLVGRDNITQCTSQRWSSFMSTVVSMQAALACYHMVIMLHTSSWYTIIIHYMQSPHVWHNSYVLSQPQPLHHSESATTNDCPCMAIHLAMTFYLKAALETELKRSLISTDANQQIGLRPTVSTLIASVTMSTVGTKKVVTASLSDKPAATVLEAPACEVWSSAYVSLLHYIVTYCHYIHLHDQSWIWGLCLDGLLICPNLAELPKSRVPQAGLPMHWTSGGVTKAPKVPLRMSKMRSRWCSLRIPALDTFLCSFSLQSFPEFSWSLRLFEGNWHTSVRIAARAFPLTKCCPDAV